MFAVLAVATDLACAALSKALGGVWRVAVVLSLCYYMVVLAPAALLQKSARGAPRRIVSPEEYVMHNLSLTDCVCQFLTVTAVIAQRSK